MKEKSLVPPDYWQDDYEDHEWHEDPEADWQEAIDRRNERVDEGKDWQGMNGF